MLKKSHPFAESASNMLGAVLLARMLVESLFRKRTLEMFPCSLRAVWGHCHLWVCVGPWRGVCAWLQ